MAVTIKFPPMVSAKRAAQAFTNGTAILDLIVANKAALIAAAEDGVAPVTVLSASLRAKFPADIKTAPVRQFVGTAIKAVLTDAGFEVLQTGVRLPRDPVFTTGAIYRKASKKQDRETDAVRDAYSSLVTGMTLAQKRILFDVLKTALGDQ